MKLKLRILLLVVFCAATIRNIQACYTTDGNAKKLVNKSNAHTSPLAPLPTLTPIPPNLLIASPAPVEPSAVSTPSAASAAGAPNAIGTIAAMAQVKSRAETVNVKTANEITLSLLSQVCGQYPECTARFYPSAVTRKEFESTITAYKKLTKEQLEQLDVWVNPTQKPQSNFKPFVQKLVLPEGSKVAMWGDLHASVHSLLRSLTKLKGQNYIDDSFKVIKPEFHMFFLGDYVDRGKYGVEVIYTLLRLKLANPNQVFLVRGNHEDLEICSTNGFGKELEQKFGYKASNNAVYDIYDTMPLAIFLGRPDSFEYIQCCHGGIEPGFDPQLLLASSGDHKYAWIGQLNRKDWIEKLPEDIKKSVKDAFLLGKENFIPECPMSQKGLIGFMWNDFIVDHGQAVVSPERYGQVWAFGKKLTHEYNYSTWLKNSLYKIIIIIRAHQHYGQMFTKLVEKKGMHRLWDDCVFTLLSAPAMESGEDFKYDSFVFVHIEKDAWSIKHSWGLVPNQK
jgi:hypothetical protein